MPKVVIGQRAMQLAGPPGHAGRYRVFVVDNRDESDIVLAVKGPFESRASARR